MIHLGYCVFRYHDMLPTRQLWSCRAPLGVGWAKRPRAHYPDGRLCPSFADKSVSHPSTWKSRLGRSQHYRLALFSLLDGKLPEASPQHFLQQLSAGQTFLTRKKKQNLPNMILSIKYNNKEYCTAQLTLHIYNFIWAGHVVYRWSSTLQLNSIRNYS